MDRRQKKTRQAIFDAFASLLEQKNYNLITVQNIIDRANIGRSTFYAHFETKDELLQALCSNIFSHVFSEPLHSEKSHDFSGMNYDLDERITHIFYHLKDNQTEIIRLLSCESGELFLGCFKDCLPPLFHDALSTAHREIPPSFLESYLADSFANAVKWWSREGMKTSPEKMAGYYLTILREGI